MPPLTLYAHACTIQTIMRRKTEEYEFTRRIHWVAIAMVALFLLMFVPAVYYSLNTPFALVDDMNDFISVNLLRVPHSFYSWMNATFIGVSEGGRYRPFFDLHNAIAWLIIGPHSALHHFVRWAEWLAGMLFWNMALWRMVRIRCHRVVWSVQDTSVFMPMLIFNAFVCFFPNQPVARLAPQELQTFCALGMLFMGTMLLLTDSDDEGTATIVIRTCILIVGYVGLSMAKEINIALMAIFCLVLFELAIVRRRGTLVAAVISAVGLLVYTIWRIHVASAAANYGVFEIGIPLLMQNLRWLTYDAFQFATSPIFAVLIIASLIAMVLRMIGLFRQFGVSLDVECLFFSLCMTLSLCAILMISWLPSLRYFYPLVPLLGWHLARGFLELDRYYFLCPARKGFLNGLTLFLLGWFVVANYYGFLLQFAVQHNARNIELRLLSKMEQRLRDGRPMAICLDMQDPERELVSSIQIYFEQFLPLYRGEKLGLHVLHSLHSAIPVELASRQRLDPAYWCLSETVSRQGSYCLLDLSRRVSALFQGRRYPYTVQDAGTHGFDYEWYLYESVAGSVGR